MTLRSSLVVFGLGSGFAWAAFLLILFTVPPEDAGVLGESFFFASLFVAFTGTLTMLGLGGRTRQSALLPVFHLRPAFRQGTLLALAIVALLLVQRFRVLRWWSVVLVVAVLVVIDVFLSRRDPEPGT